MEYQFDFRKFKVFAYANMYCHSRPIAEYKSPIMLFTYKSKP